MIFNVKYMDSQDYNFIPIEEATWFIENNIEGYITKKDLDFQRNKSRNATDMMLTYSIIYHME